MVGIAVLIQFIPSNKPEVVKSNPNDLIVNNEIPDTIQQLLKTSCYDCHSNETAYPWYSNIAPVSFLVSRDTKVGRHELNFSEWESLSTMKKLKQLNKIADEVSEGEMPMVIYTAIHRDARLTESQQQLLVDWTNGFAESLTR